MGGEKKTVCWRDDPAPRSECERASESGRALRQVAEFQRHRESRRGSRPRRTAAWPSARQLAPGHITAQWAGSDASQETPVVVFSRSDALVFRVAQRFHIALDAFRFARVADPASVPDQLVRKLDPLFLRNDLHQVLFDLLWIFISRQVQAV